MLTMILYQSFAVMSSLLYGVSAHDVSIYALVLFVLSAAAWSRVICQHGAP